MNRTAGFTIYLFGVLLFSFGILFEFSSSDLKQHQPELLTPTKKHNGFVEAVSMKPSKLEQIKNWKSQNEDLAGWITIQDTRIDYPVMYLKGSDFYLYHDFYKKDLKSGTLFIDKHNTIEPRDTNLIIYGHSMYDGTMFHDLLYYLDVEFYKTHQTIEYSTIDSIDTYEIVSVFRSKVYHKDENVFKYYQFYRANNEQEYSTFISNVKQLSLYDTGVIPESMDDLITLSTCDESIENGRLVVVARKIASTKD